MRKGILLVAAALVAAAPAADMGFGVEADASSRYLWRGLVLSDGAVLQPSVWLSLGALTLSAWGNLASATRPLRVEMDELDLVLGYEEDWRGFALRPALAWYQYPLGGAQGTFEAMLDLEYAAGPLALKTGHALDIVAAPGAYFGTAGFEVSRELLPACAVSGGLSAGWASVAFNRHNLGLSRAAFNLAQADAGIEWRPAGAVYVRPHATLAWLVDPWVAAAAGNRLSFGIGLALGSEF